MGGRLSFTYLWGLFFFFLKPCAYLICDRKILPFQKPRHLCITLTAVVYLVFQKPWNLCIALTAVVYLVSNYSELLLKHTNLLAPIIAPFSFHLCGRFHPVGIKEVFQRLSKS